MIHSEAKPGPGDSANDPHAGALLRLLERPVPQNALEENASVAAAPPDAGYRGRVGVLLFQLGDETLALPTKHLRRIMNHVAPTLIPHRTSPILRGLCNIRGELVPCGDLRRLLLLPEREPSNADAQTGTDARRMVVVGPAAASWVFEVDSTGGVERIDPATLDPAPITVGHFALAFVAGLMEHQGRHVAVLDVDRVLAGFAGALA